MAQASNLPKSRPPVRPDIWTPDSGDQARLDYAWGMWHSQDNLYLRRDRLIEENIRMLAGQQWAMYSKVLGRFVDITHMFTDREKKWRQRPVFNKLLGWFMLTHARLTENPPVISFSPATQDRADADLAEVMDTIFKVLWEDVGMLEVIDRIVSWLAPAGSSYWKTIVNPNVGDIIEWGGPATLSMDGADGSKIERFVDDAPLDENGEPLAHLVGNGDEWEPTGKAFREYEGGIDVEVLAAIQVRGQWGNAVPWHKKAWHEVRTFLTPEEIFDRTGVEVEPDADKADMDRAHDIRRVLMGAGFFGSIDSLEDGFATLDREGAEGYVDCVELWEPPTTYPGMQRGQDEYEEPGGRFLWVTRNKVLRDGMRPAPYRHTSPIRHLPFVSLPGRPSGTTPQESLNPQQRAYNRRYAQIFEHDNLASNPIGIADKSQGIKKGDITDEPGQWIYSNRKSGNSAPPIEYVAPPGLSPDVWRTVEAIDREFRETGNLEGNQGSPPTRDASGELIKELRFNEDRYIAATARRFAIELGRTMEDWIVTLPYIWSQEKTLAWAGEDQILRTVLVTPDLFEKGRVNVIPDIESMLPEGRGERQQKHRLLWLDGAYGDPQSPEAINWFLKLARFPHLGRAVRPGGPDRIMAETENGRLAQGEPAATVAILEWQAHDVHLSVHEEFMKGPDYLKLPVEVQQEFVNHWMATRMAAQAAFENQLIMEGHKRVAANQAVADVEAASPQPQGIPAGGDVEPAQPKSAEGPPDTAVA